MNDWVEVNLPWDINELVYKKLTPMISDDSEESEMLNEKIRADNLKIKQVHAFKYSAHAGMLVEIKTPKNIVCQCLIGDILPYMEMGVESYFSCSSDHIVLRYKIVYMPEVINLWEQDFYG